MKKIIFACLTALLITSCTESVKIKGNITGAEDKMLYIEHNTLSANEVIDSVKLNKKGKFSFSIPTSKYPDFYKLRLEEQNIVITTDSLSELIVITADANSMTNATFEGSTESQEIQKLRASSFKLQELAQHKMVDEVEKSLAEHKNLARDIILRNTRSGASYYAIYQTINGYYYISPSDKEGLQMWSAVATAYDVYYPNYDRSIALKTTTLNAIRQQRGLTLDAKRILESTESTGFIEIALPNRLDEQVKLSSQVGRLTLIDFSAYGMESAVAHTLYLRELYEVYHKQGLDIFQISLDQNKLFWLEQTRDIPWICVRDKEAPLCSCIDSYNVTQLPTFFLMNKEGEIIGRYNHENIEQAIKENL